jgi:mono/diheme cytochrome c family protein
VASGPISGTKAHGGREADTASTPARVDMTAGLPNGLKGDLKRGGAFYLANCATCHGARGDGAGPRAYFINPKPRNFVEDGLARALEPSGSLRRHFGGQAGHRDAGLEQGGTPQQMADVAEYVFQSFIQW